MNTHRTVARTLFLALLAIHQPSIAQNNPPQAAAESVEVFNLEEIKNASHDDPTRRKWNWEIKLSPGLSTRRFRIAQQTQGKNGPVPQYSSILFDERALQKSSEDIVHFKLHSGDEKPTLNMNRPGNVGLGVSFSRMSGGFGSSNWIVLPGRIVKSEARKQGTWQNGQLILLSIDTRDATGNEYHTDVKLEESK